MHRFPVALVGAGPGGADLITVRGARLLAQADVVVHDRLSDAELLDLASPAAELVDVGKCKGGGARQDEINALLVDRARRGLRVVRLKGGDPFVYGRGGEEADALRAAGLEVEVVPGLTSALAAPALAGIAVTERGGAASVAVISGHRARPGDGYDYAALAAAVDTIVVLMGATTARSIADELLLAGLAPDHPVAAVHRAGTVGEELAVLTLGRIAEHGCPFPSPTVLVIGDAAGRGRYVVRSAHLRHGRTPSSASSSFACGST